MGSVPASPLQGAHHFPAQLHHAVWIDQSLEKQVTVIGDSTLQLVAIVLGVVGNTQFFNFV
ncbi:MAG: hypothetical protein OXG53_00705 [Chloroflexi bacterium]|nr:hypothetical protein [Chloroflexota bacterium]